jgi:hypothetical protein
MCVYPRADDIGSKTCHICTLKACILSKNGAVDIYTTKYCKYRSFTSTAISIQKITLKFRKITPADSILPNTHHFHRTKLAIYDCVDTAHKTVEHNFTTMKAILTLYLSFLTVCITAHDAVDKNVRRNRRISGDTNPDHSADRRTLRMTPTLLKKFLSRRQKNDTFDGVLGDFLFGMAPSDSPSTTPSNAPSSLPSYSPSTSPSLLPSESPSALPSVMPSAAPFSWNDVVLDRDSNLYRTCRSKPTPANYTTDTELAILYSYRLELLPDTHVFKTLEKIENLLDNHLVEQFCNTSSFSIGLSSSPSDIPGGKSSIR